MDWPTYNLHPIKQARFERGYLIGHGYALAGMESVATNALDFSFKIPSGQDVSFVFGFQGVGLHYRCDFHPSSHLVILHWLRDGIPVYLQHASIRLEASHQLRIHWSFEGIRIFRDHTCLINVLAAGDIRSGHWGFASTTKPLLPPIVDVQRLPLPNYRQVILGDGYSNNRWKNRHFFSWPELAFGHREDYLNACVAAGNTRRVLQIGESVLRNLDRATVIIAAGADDFIEGESLDATLGRLRQLIHMATDGGADSVHLCSIPPRGRGNDKVRNHNQSIQLLASTEADGFIDFHDALGGETSAMIVNGDYPGAEAQRLMARKVLSHLGMSLDLAPIHHEPGLKAPPSTVIRVLNRVSRKIDAILGRLPFGGIS